MNGTQPNATAERVGWKSRMEVTLGTVRRVVLQGNVLDAVLEETGELIPLPDWLIGQLHQRGYRRIVAFDHAADPVVHDWDGLGVGERLAAFMQFGGATPPAHQADVTNPLVVLNQLRRMLADPQVPAACVLMLQEHRFRSPSAETVALHHLTSAAAAVTAGGAVTVTTPGDGWSADSGAAPAPRPAPMTAPVGPVGDLRNLAVLIYPDENLIPGEFLRADPDTAVVRIPYPSFAERGRFFNLNQAAFFNEPGAGYDPENLARTTEGLRLRELQQLAVLSQRKRVGVASLRELQDLLRFGRQENPWRTIGSRAQATDALKPVRGQREPVQAAQDALFRGKWGLGNLLDPGARKPPLVCFFVGSTGVGKTMLARCMAHFLTGSADGLKIIDMSEYRQDHSVHRLIGAPPSYVGFSEGGQLTNWVKERPFSLVLFDEIEKAHERIMDIFLQILDGARLTDGKGETVDFSHTGLIFTSNIGTEALEDASAGATPPVGRADPGKRARTVAFFTEQVENYFDDIDRPEIYNRLKSGIVVFNSIERDDALADIRDKLRLITNGVNDQLDGGGGIDDTDPAVIEQLLGHVDYRRYGLRDVNNMLITELGNPIARFLDSAEAQRFRLPTRYQYRWNAVEQRLEIARRGQS